MTISEKIFSLLKPGVRYCELDEAPFAYRTLDDIKEVIGETVKIDKIIKPVYNYKAGG